MMTHVEALVEHKDNTIIRNLIIQDMPLNGIHLIEASAGTGKTYSITRIFLRLLLEKKLDVQQILVMTFTKDATEELRGRIDDFIREALNNWTTLCEKDPFFIDLATKLSKDEASLLLRKALLFMDEAAIYTIHGFCKNVLNQYAFESGVSFSANLEAEQQTIVQQSVNDWYRFVASESRSEFLQMAKFWPVPNSFLHHFSKAIYSDEPLELVGSDELLKAFQGLCQQACDKLEHNRSFLFEHLVDNKKGAEQIKRADEYKDLLNHLSEGASDPLLFIQNKLSDAFFSGRRYSRSVVKEELKEVFNEVLQVKEKAKTLLADIERLKALEVVKKGIYRVRTQIVESKDALNLMSFDDLIKTLSSHLQSERGRELAKSLLVQYPCALVDEFQDTDPDQYAILKTVYFNQPNNTLMMIGDPKQAIYGFRGGDIFAYMEARNDCNYQWLMDTNWRSTPQMINSYNRLFYGTALKEGGNDVFGFNIPYHPVKASEPAINQSKELLNESALKLVHFSPQELKRPVPQSYRPQMATWCANKIVELLKQTQSADKVEAKDIALLVRDASEAIELKEALLAADVPSVYLSNRANLFHSEQTKQLIQLLKGVLYLENERLFSASVACSLLPYSPKAYYQLSSDDLSWQQLKTQFSELRELWRVKGFITMALKLMHEHMEIKGTDSERTLTNLLHLFEMLQTAGQRYKQPQELLNWFEQQSVSDNPSSENELRLESEDNLIRIVTQHGSKGLEYPIVFIPFATRHKSPLSFSGKHLQLFEYHDSTQGKVLSLSADSDIKKAVADEAYAETIRLLYVAITRAKKRCYLLSCEFDNFHLSPLGLTSKWQRDTDIEQAHARLTEDNPEDISLEVVTDWITAERSQLSKQQELLPTVSKFNGKIERDWWLSSFTALNRNIRDNGVSTPDRDNKNGLNAPDTINNAGEEFRFLLTKGARTGNLLHDIFEHLNFAQPDWVSACKWPLLKYKENNSLFDNKALEAWLQDVLNTPLGNRDKTLSLSLLPFDKTLREVEFYFPLENASTTELSQLLIRHRANSQGSGTSRGIRSLSIHKHLKGMMHGFIDLVFEYQGQYYVGDYKSNHLGECFDDYSLENMQMNIEQHHYDLQYLIYSLALHRYLESTLSDYDPELHFGGVYYFYLRGMTAIQQYEGAGVFYRRITPNELSQLDQIFAGKQSHENALTNENGGVHGLN